jgi:S-DNA-T family DNA segregation ATPase FtsK/SpoIIIE
MSHTDSADSTRKRVDLTALTFLFLVLLLAGVLLGGESFALLPPLFGPLGSELRGELLHTLGLGIYALLLGMVVLSGHLFWRSSWWNWSLRATGWLILTFVAAYASARFTPFEVQLTLVGEGGVLGEFLHRWSQLHFESTGVDLLFGSVTFLGLLLTMDRLLLWLWQGSKFTLQGICELIVRFFSLFRLPQPPNLTPVAFAPVSPKAQAAPLGNPSIPINVAPPEEMIPTGPIPINRSLLPAGPVAKRSNTSEYELPSLDLLDESEVVTVENQDEKLRDVAVLLEKTFKDFGLNIKVVGIHTGPVITQYEISLETGLRVTRVTALADDLALNLRVSSVRIVAPIPGRNTVGIEVPNEQRQVVRLKELITLGAPKIAKSKLPLCLGKDSEGRALIYDLADMPHLLIAGRTGTGKSVCLNSIILSLLLTRTPHECKLLMIDPKQVELAEYGRLPHLMHPVVTDNSKAEAILAWGVDKMEERYEILRRARVRNIASYNELSHEEIYRRVKPVDQAERDRTPPQMPYIVIVIDEVGDLMMAMKKEVEGHIIRLAQKSRAAGIHLILTTQRPTVDVITGLIKSNLPARICFQVADRSNSRVVLDEMGAEKLLGKGDMLFLQPSTSTIVRAQGTYASDQEIARIVGILEVEDPEYDSELLNLQNKEEEGPSDIESLRKRDPLYEQAIEIVIREGRGSVSLLQRALGIGYGRAARLIDFMAEDGIVGTYNGAQAREVLFSPEQWESFRNGEEPAPQKDDWEMPERESA